MAVVNPHAEAAVVALAVVTTVQVTRHPHATHAVWNEHVSSLGEDVTPPGHLVDFSQFHSLVDVVKTDLVVLHANHLS